MNNSSMITAMELLQRNWKQKGSQFVSPCGSFMFWRPGPHTEAGGNELRYYQFNKHLNDFFIVRAFDMDNNRDAGIALEIVRKEARL